ncbi:hypothetical protein ACLB2K_073488 [Fragaria x ananassa]
MEREPHQGACLEANQQNYEPCVSGAKRVFSDAIDGASGKWVFSGSGGSEAELGKGGSLVSPRGVNGGKGLAGSECKSQQISAVKDGVLQQSPNPLHEKKPQVSAPAAKWSMTLTS